jgi:hypothetical protein
MMNWIDKFIEKRADNDTEKEIYQARWVWYHTILSLLMLIVLGIFILLAVKL